MIKRISVILIIGMLSVTASLLYSQTETIRLAVAPFMPLTSGNETKSAGISSSRTLEKRLGGMQWFELRPLGAVQNYLTSLERVQLGLDSPASVKGIARKLKINYLTVGSVAKIGSRCEVDMRIVDINNWNIVYASGAGSSSMGGASSAICSTLPAGFTRERLETKVRSSRDSPAISVYAFDHDNPQAMKAGYGGTFAEILNSELGANQEIAVVERTHAKALLNEKVMEMVGIVENDNSNEEFRVRGISYRVAGVIRMFGNLICMSYRVINTSTGNSVYMGYSELGSPAALRPLARRIAASLTDALNNRIGTLDLSSEPKHARVFIDGKEAGKTPVILQVNKGTHSLKLVLEDYMEFEKEITIAPRAIAKERIRLQKDTRKAEEIARKRDEEEKARLESERLEREQLERKARERAIAEREKAAAQKNKERNERAGNIPSL
ncbi:MAG TPA: PEGA domain-containing protein [Spirochaetota bacterium]|nr:PEGA domain-containing protein [Spirochaetota bacterium]